MAFHIYHDITINAAQEFIFNAIMKPDHLINWWPLKCKVENGNIYNFFFGQEYDWYGKLIESNAAERLVFEMFNCDEDWNGTTLHFEIIPDGASCLLRFEHRDWPVLNHHFRRSSCCWAILLKGLKMYIEQNEIIAFEERG